MKAWHRRLLATAGIVSGMALSTAGCGSSNQAAGPTEDERAVCATLQSMMDQLQNGEGEAALVSLENLQVVAADTKNTQLNAAGTRLFTAIGKPVENAGSLTVSQTRELGNRVVAEGSAGLADFINACRKLKLDIRIDTAKLQKAAGVDSQGHPLPSPGPDTTR